MQAVRAAARSALLPRPRAARAAAMAAPAAPPLLRLSRPLRVAVLNSPGHDHYAAMFARLLRSALAEPSLLTVESFETEARALPPHGAFDGYILSGSRHGAYEQLPWIEELLAWTREAVQRKARLLGVCFGHQVIAQALGGRVVPNPRGFEIGGLGMPLTPQARAYFAKLLGGEGGAPPLGAEGGAAACVATPTDVRMLYVHGDAVEVLPPGFFSLGGSALSPCNGMADGDRVLTWQGHPEFDAATVEGLLPVLDSRGLVPGRLPPGQDVAAVRASLEAAALDTAFLARAAVALFTQP